MPCHSSNKRCCGPGRSNYSVLQHSYAIFREIHVACALNVPPRFKSSLQISSIWPLFPGLLGYSLLRRSLGGLPPFPRPNAVLIHSYLALSLHDLDIYVFPSLVAFANSAIFGQPQRGALVDSANSTAINDDSNQTSIDLASRSGVLCKKIHGEDLNAGSCRNAWQKIRCTSHTQWFIPRSREPGEASYNNVLIPVRYLSDDGICAIVRWP